METTNKAGIKPIPVDQYVVTASMVTEYLERELGCKVITDYSRWTGPNANNSYVRMRCILDPRDIEVKDASSDYVATFLGQQNADIKFKDTIMNVRKPFMYPENILEIMQNPKNADSLIQRGIFGDRAVEIVQHTKFEFSKEYGCWKIYLRPERIIFDMLKNPSTNKIDGNAAIIAVTGTTSDTIQWLITVADKGRASTSAVDMDAIFKHA
jgi:hypothetical protein